MRAGVAGGVLSTLAVAGAAGAENADDPKGTLGPDDLFFYTVIIGVAMAALLIFAIPWFFARRQYMKNQNETFSLRIKAERERHQQAMEQLRRTTELATLMELNQDQIKTYHDIVTEQADKSFKSSRTAMHVGLILLVAAAIGGVKVPIEEVRWFIGALALFSTVFSAYLSRTYLLLYRESISQLNRYFDQPVLNSFYLTAERLTEGLDEQHQQEVRRRIIEQVLETSTRIGGKSVEVADHPVAAVAAQVRGPKKPRKRKPKKRTASVNGTPV
ncbi:hypothetical protein ACFWHF_14410 [Streptomyces griseoincarnatus]